MRDWLNVVLLVALILGVIVAIVYGVRLISNAATPITLHSPKPGVTCAAMVAGDGAAISCWKD